MKVIWSPHAVEQAKIITRHIAEDNPVAARHWLNGAFDKTKALEAFPGIGRVVAETNDPDTRELIYGNYRIIYRYDKEGVEILAVRHCKQLLLEEEIKGHA